MSTLAILPMLIIIGYVIGFMFVLAIFVFLITKRVKEHKSETFEKRNW